MTNNTEQTAQTAVAKAQPKEIDTVRAVFEKMKGQFAMVLPKHITPDRMVRVALTAIQNTPKLLECDKKSLYSAVMRAAQLGLEPDGVLGQAYLIPYGKTVQFIPGYKGLIDLARRSGEVSNIIAKEVCEHDNFAVDFSQEIPFVHKPKLDGDRGDVTHFWALARFKDGGFHWDYLTVDEVIAIRNQSSGWQSAIKFNKQKDSPWEKHFIEMGKKTAIRRIAKYLPMSVQKAAVIEDLIDANKKFTTDELGDIVIEGDNGDVIEGNELPPGDRKASKLDSFAGTPHDPETGEIKEQVATQNAAAAASEAPGEVKPPEAIQMFYMPEDNTQPDLEGWALLWQSVVATAPDATWLKDLKKKNDSILKSVHKLNPPKHEWCIEVYDVRLAQLSGKGRASA